MHSGGDHGWSERFAELFTPRFIEYARCDTIFELGPPPTELISRLHCIALNQRDEVIVCRSVDGWRFLPGGTREPNEALSDLVSRELMEEAGAEVLNEPTIFAADRAESRRDHPYRPHMPHPLAYWAFAVVRAEVVQPPTNPDDGEQVLEVLTLPVPQACEYLAGGTGLDDRLAADVVRLADEMGLLSPEKVNR